MARMKNSFAIVDEEAFGSALIASGFVNAADARKRLLAGNNKGTYRIVSVRSGTLTIRTEEVRKLEEVEDDDE